MNEISFQIHGNGSRGDLADSFAFPTFFPNVIQPPIALVCNSIFAILVRVKLCRKPVRRYDIAGGGGGAAGGIGGAGGAASISISLPGVESHDTERRRQIALKALSERLNRSDSGGATSPSGGGAPAGVGGDAQASAASWPSLEEDGKLESVHVPVEKPAEGGGGGDGGAAAAGAGIAAAPVGANEQAS